MKGGISNLRENKQKFESRRKAAETVYKTLVALGKDKI